MTVDEPRSGIVALLLEAADRSSATFASSTFADGEVLCSIRPNDEKAFGVTFRGSACNGLLWIDLPTGDQIGPFEVFEGDKRDLMEVVSGALHGGLIVRLRRGLLGWYPDSIDFGRGTWGLESGATERLAHKYSANVVVSCVAGD